MLNYWLSYRYQLWKSVIIGYQYQLKKIHIVHPYGPLINLTFCQPTFYKWGQTNYSKHLPVYITQYKLNIMTFMKGSLKP